MQGLLADEIPDDIGILPLLERRTVLHVLGNVVTAFIPPNANFLTLIEAAAEHSSREQLDSNISKRWYRSARMVTLMVFDEVLLAVENAITSIN